MIRLSVLYGHPLDADAFEKYYVETHTALAAKIPGMEKFELTKFYPNADGSAPAHYRMAGLYFKDIDTLTSAFNSEDGKIAAGDIAKFATGGATFLVAEAEYVKI